MLFNLKIHILHVHIQILLKNKIIQKIFAYALGCKEKPHLFSDE